MEVILNGKITYLKQGQYIKNGEILEVKKPKGLMLEWDFENGIWAEKATPLMLYKFKNREVESLNTPYHIELMEQEGGTTKQDFYTYLGQKYAYDNQVKEEQKAKYEAYELLLKDNPNLTWEEFEQQYGNNVMMNLSLVERLQEPTIPESVKKFMEKYL